MDPLAELQEHVIEGKADETHDAVQKLIDDGVGVEKILKEGLVAAMDIVGQRFQDGEYFIPEMLVAARAMQKGLELIRPLLREEGVEPMGKVLLATVKGDHHDIGKNLVGMALEGAGFIVEDLGSDVGPDQFVEAIKEHKPSIIGMSALLTSTMLSMQDIVRAIEDAGLRNSVYIMVGGAPLTDSYCQEIEADGFAQDAIGAVNLAKRHVQRA